MKKRFLELFEQAAFEVLTSRERSVIFRHYGIDGCDAASLTDTGKAFKISRERARQIASSAVEKIYSRSQHKTVIDEPSNCQKLAGYLESVSGAESPREVLSSLLASNVIELDGPRQHKQLAMLLSGVSPKLAKKTISNFAEDSKRALRQIKSQGRMDLKFDQVLAGVEWPKSLSKARIELGKRIKQKRDTNTNAVGLYEHFDSEKLGRHVYYDSNLELSFYKILDQASLVEYYAEQPFEIVYGSSGDKRKYFPDVYVLLKDGRGFIVEVKPRALIPLWGNLCKYNALADFCRSEGLGYSMTSINANFSSIIKTTVRPEYECEVLKAICRKNIFWSQYLEIKEKFDPTFEEFTALIAKNKLVWLLEPFRLGMPKRG